MFLGLIGFSPKAEAQVNVNINIGNQPLWGPVGYEYVRYYYLPEIDVYYNVANKKYTYFQGNRWVTKSKLPGRYKNFDIYRTYKVVLNNPNPWNHHDRNRREYGRFAHNRSQVIIRDAGRRPQPHQMHNKKHKDNRFDKGRPHNNKKHDDRRPGRH